MSTLHENSDHAVIVNPKAVGTRGGALERIAEVVAPDSVYLADDSTYDEVVSTVVERGYRTVFTAGGDGTANRFINALTKRGSSARIGVLPMGARNGLADVVSTGDAMADLRSYVQNPSADIHHLPLCEAEGIRFSFAGLGLDASALEDYDRLKRTIARGPLRGLQGPSGYAAAIVAMTLPRRLFRRKLQVRIVNTGGNAYTIKRGPRGAVMDRTIRTGEVLYEGPVNAALMGTCPSFGHRYQLLPYAGLEPSRFHLRVSNVAPTRLLLGLRSLRKGTISHKELRDFMVEAVSLEFSEPVAYQLAGEMMGQRQRLTVSMAQDSVDLVRFL
ncbi:MAG: diacylglycerol kinase family enzyme [Myxococcota bacterium]|jgi:diacylglycerol kinase family enzyme